MQVYIRGQHCVNRSSIKEDDDEADSDEDSDTEGKVWSVRKGVIFD